MLKVALTDLSASIVRVQVGLFPEHAPPQVTNCDPASAVAVKVTLVPGLYVALQVPPQLIPAGFDVTVPVPVPLLVTVRVRGFTTGSNLASTVMSAFMVTVHVPVPEHPPPFQPANCMFRSGVAVKVTLVPGLYVALQVAPQLMPAGLEVTVPVPVPLLVTISASGFSVKVAVTVVAAFTITVHVPVPEQPPPLQPGVKSELASGAAVKVTLVP